MKNVFLVLLLSITFHLFGNEEIDKDKLSQALGHLIVRHLVNPGFEFNLDKVIQGIQDERTGIPSPMSEEEYEQSIYAIQETIFLQTAEKNLAQADAFLKNNMANEGVKEIDAKLQYKIAKEGLGDMVDTNSTPLVHYKGTLIDGSVFASSQDSQEPIPLPIKQTIPGFSKGLVGMKEGEKRILYVHPELAYGVSGHLPPNSLLIFEVEVIKANSQTEISQNQEGASPDQPS